MDPGTQKGDPAYVTDLTATGTIIENEHFRFDVGGFTDWTVKDIGASAPEDWGAPINRVWVMNGYGIFDDVVPPATAALVEEGPVRTRVLLSPVPGAAMGMTFYAGAHYYERSIVALPVNPGSVSFNNEEPAGNGFPIAEASGVAATPFSVDLPSETDFQASPTAVAGTAHAWIGCL